MTIEKINKVKVLVEIDAKLAKKIDAYRKKKSTPTHKVSKRAVFEAALAEFFEKETA